MSKKKRKRRPRTGQTVDRPWGELFLCGPTGDVEHRYICDRTFGRIERDGHIYRSLHKRDLPHILQRTDPAHDAYIAAVAAELQRIDTETATT